ncbi:MAG: extracellular matrix regulator RemB [Oscillospiraceae bacterium]
MYLHIGQDTVLNDNDIIGIFDLDNTTSSKVSREFLNSAEKNGEVTIVGDDIPKSFVLCEGEGAQSVYLSQLGTATLKLRSETFTIE